MALLFGGNTAAVVVAVAVTVTEMTTVQGEVAVTTAEAVVVTAI
jgi:hypothetical protein